MAEPAAIAIQNQEWNSWGEGGRPREVPKPSMLTRMFQYGMSLLDWNNQNNAAGIASKSVAVFSNGGSFLSGIFSAAIKGNSATESQYPVEANSITKIVKVSYVALIALALYDIAKQIPRLKDHPFDASMRIIKDLSDAGFASSSAITGFQEVGLISANALKCIPVINISAAVLSSAEFFLHARAVILQKENIRVLTRCPDNVRSLQGLVREIRDHQDEQAATELYGMQHHELKDYLNKIDNLAMQKLQGQKFSDRIRGKQVYQKAIVNLTQRSKENAYTSQMAMIAAMIATIALIALAISPGGAFALVGFGLLAVAATLQTVALVLERRSYHRFRRSLEIVEPD